MDSGLSFTFQGNPGNGLIVVVIILPDLLDPQKYFYKILRL